MAGNGTSTASKSKDQAHLDPDASDIGEQMTRLRDDLGALTKTVAEFGGNKVEKTGRDLAKTSQDAIDTVRAEVSSIEHDIRQTIRDKPLQAIGIAVGIGFLASLLMRR